MIRNSHLSKLLGATLFAAAAAAAPAHAGVITFEAYAGPVGGTEVWQEDGYNVGFYANVAGGGAGYLVGQFLDGDVSSCDTSSMACPPNPTGTYYAALNDSYIDIWNQNNIPGFKVNSFDASFVGSSPVLNSYPAVPAVLRLQGILSDGSYLLQDFALNGATPSGFQFGHFNTTGAFASTTFVELLAFGLVCNATGSSCTAFNTNRAQFAIDNISLTEVPEPATAAIVGLGLLGLGAARRRRKA